MKDFKWLKAAVDEVCEICHAKIRQGDGFYFEATLRQPHCRDCGRVIRDRGYDAAKTERNWLLKLLTGRI